MQQFFAEPSWITESEILIRGADLNHMKNVLRMKVGEDVRTVSYTHLTLPTN